MNDYIRDYKALKNEFNLEISTKLIEIEGHKSFELLSLPFKSDADFVYPDGDDYADQGRTFTSLLRYYCNNNQYSNTLIFNSLETQDKDVSENKIFRIPILKPAGKTSYKRAVFLMHGLNEKNWSKYLPWALKLMEETASPVILFPIAFHMNRAPEAWANPREMMKVANERKQFVGADNGTSFLNVALSHRIQFAPHRFFSSGIQTYYDIIKFIDEIKLGAHPFFDKDCRFDFFSYSIGATLTEVLLTSNYNGYFNDSRAFLFCGGAALDTSNPVCKTIMDRDAHSELFRWLGTLFSSVTDMSRRVKEIFFQELPEVLNFKSFMFYDKMLPFRENALKQKSSDIFELSLKKDTVFPPEAVCRTFKGANNDITIQTDVRDFPYEYKHEDPFPVMEENRNEINSAFEEVFSTAASFINKTA